MNQDSSLKNKLRDLYEGESKSAHKFRYTLLIADIITVVFLIVSSFFYGSSVVKILDLIFAVYLTTDYLARLWIATKKFSFCINILNIADLIAVLSSLAPFIGVNFTFLRALRILRLLRSYSLQKKLSEDFIYFRQHQDIIISATNLFIFIFLMTELVFVTQVGSNQNVTNFLDAMYFTIAALTTTGFGDVTLQGQSGRAISIVVMIFGVSLFLRLIQTMFRPAKVRYVCQFCGLFLHESDAVRCKHC